MKSENWIKWDLDSRLGWRMAGFVAEYGAIGYGVFVILVEMLYRAEEHKLSFDTNAYNLYTKLFKIIQTDLEQIIGSLVLAGLLQRDENHFWSDRVLQEIAEREGKAEALSQKRQDAVNTRWNKEKAKKSKVVENTKSYKSIQPDTSAIQNDTNDTRLDKIRLDQNRLLEVETHVPKKLLEKKQTKEEIREIITESLASAKLGKELDAITAQEIIQPMESPSLKLKNGTALNVAQNFKPLTDDITSNQMFVSLGRRPLEKYPEIWITPLELKQVLDTAFDKKVEAKEIFAQVSTFVKDKIQAGEPLHRIKAVPALLGWGLQEALNIQTAEIRRDNQKNYKSGNAKAEQPSPYKNFKVVS